MIRSPKNTDYLPIVAAALAAEAGLDPGQVEADQELATIDGIESVKIMRAVARLEEECSIAVPDDFLFEVSTVRNLADLISTLAAR